MKPEGPNKYILRARQPFKPCFDFQLISSLEKSPLQPVVKTDTSSELDASLIMATALTPAWRKERVLDGPYSKEIQRFDALAASIDDSTVLFMGGVRSESPYLGNGVYELRRSFEHVATEGQSEIITWSVQPVKIRTPGPVFGHGNACVTLSKMFVIYGGSGEFDGNDALFALDLDRLEWSRYCPKKKPPARLLHTTSGVGSTLYIFGGRTGKGQYLNDIYTFDLHKFDNGWHHLPVHGSVPAPRYGHTMVVHEEKLYMFGGGNGKGFFNDLWGFDVATSSWTELKPNGHQPQKRVEHSAAIVHGVMYVYGGISRTNQDWEWISWLDAYHIARDCWYEFWVYLSDPQYRLGATMTVSGTDIVIFGGELDLSGAIYPAPSSGPWVYTLDTSKIDFDQQQPDSMVTSEIDSDQQQPDNSALIQALDQSEDWTQARYLTRYRDSSSLATEATNVSQSRMVTTSLQLNFYFAKPNQYRQTSREARLDTQADGNFMSETLVDFLGHEVRPYTGRRFNTASGDVTPIGEVSVIFQWQESAKMRKKRFLVLPDTGSLPCDIILGINFISEFEVYLFNNSLLVLALANVTPTEKQRIRDSAAQQEQQRKDEEKAEADENRAKRDIQRQGKQQVRQQQQPWQVGESSASAGG